MLNRRLFLQTAAYMGAAVATRQANGATPRRRPVIDTHIHLFDPTRPGGVPWPEKTDTAIFKPALPQTYRKVAEEMGVVGAIAVEASPLSSDNAWVLSVAAKDPIIVGLIGDLVPGSAEYPGQLEVLRRNPIFLGIRYGNLWGRDLAADLRKPGFLEGLKALAGAGLVLESANPDPRLIHALVEAAHRVPDLTIIVDHLPHGTVPTAAPERAAYLADLAELSQSPRVFIKLSEILTERQTLASKRSSLTAALDRLWGTFGEDKILYGSDWPNSEHFASYAEVFGFAEAYVESKGAVAAEKFFSRNSVRAYGWKPRDAAQILTA